MYIFMLIIHIIASLVLVLVILLQAGKGGGLSEAFGGGAQTIFGTKTATFLTRATAVCAVLFLITSLSLAVLSGMKTRSLLERAPLTQQVPAQTPASAAGVKKIRQVQIDPKTGKEIVIKEEEVPAVPGEEKQ